MLPHRRIRVDAHVFECGCTFRATNIERGSDPLASIQPAQKRHCGDRRSVDRGRRGGSDEWCSRGCTRITLHRECLSEQCQRQLGGHPVDPGRFRRTQPGDARGRRHHLVRRQRHRCHSGGHPHGGLQPGSADGRHQRHPDQDLDRPVGVERGHRCRREGHAHSRRHPRSAHAAHIGDHRPGRHTRDGRRDGDAHRRQPAGAQLDGHARSAATSSSSRRPPVPSGRCPWAPARPVSPARRWPSKAASSPSRWSRAASSR